MEREEDPPSESILNVIIEHETSMYGDRSVERQNTLTVVLNEIQEATSSSKSNSPFNTAEPKRFRRISQLARDGRATARKLMHGNKLRALGTHREELSDAKRELVGNTLPRAKVLLQSYGIALMELMDLPMEPSESRRAVAREEKTRKGTEVFERVEHTLDVVGKRCGAADDGAGDESEYGDDVAFTAETLSRERFDLYLAVYGLLKWFLPLLWISYFFYYILFLLGPLPLLTIVTDKTMRPSHVLAALMVFVLSVIGIAVTGLRAICRTFGRREVRVTGCEVAVNHAESEVLINLATVYDMTTSTSAIPGFGDVKGVHIFTIGPNPNSYAPQVTIWGISNCEQLRREIMKRRKIYVGKEMARRGRTMKEHRELVAMIGGANELLESQLRKSSSPLLGAPGSELLERCGGDRDGVDDTGKTTPVDGDGATPAADAGFAEQSPPLDDRVLGTFGFPRRPGLTLRARALLVGNDVLIPLNEVKMVRPSKVRGEKVEIVTEGYAGFQKTVGQVLSDSVDASERIMREVNRLRAKERQLQEGVDDQFVALVAALSRTCVLLQKSTEALIEASIEFRRS